MKSHRKPTLKSAIIYAITFAIGVILGCLVKPREQTPEEWDWEKWLETHPPVEDSSGSTSWYGLVWVDPSFEDTQPVEIRYEKNI